MRYKILVLTFAAGMLTLAGCGSKEKQANPEMEKSTLEMEGISESLDSTMDHIKELETDLKSALDDLDN